MKNLKLSQIIALSLILALPVLINSCHPGGPSATEDLDIVVTMHSEEFDFQGAITFTMPDTVMHIIGEDDDPDDVDRSFDELILLTTKTNMDALGYKWMEFDTLNPADVVLLATALANTNSGVAYNPGWWGYWGYWPGWGGYPGSGYWGPGYGYGYPGGYPIYYSYSTGSIFLTMINPLEFDLETETIGVVWMAAMNGLLEGNNDDNSGSIRISEGINQAFKQSVDILNTN